MTIKLPDFATIMNSVDTALGVVQKFASVPGVNLIPYVSTISSVVSVGHALIAAGKEGVSLFQNMKTTFAATDGLPTDEAMAALDAQIATARAKLHAPMPPREDGEPE